MIPNVDSRLLSEPDGAQRRFRGRRASALSLVAFSFVLGAPASASTAVTPPNVLPIMKQWKAQAGQLRLTERTRVVVANGDTKVIDLLQAKRGWLSRLRYTTGLKLPLVTSVPREADIVFDSNPSDDFFAAAKAAKLENKPAAAAKASRSLEPNVLSEGYQIQVGEGRVKISYRQPTGALRGLQTLTQMLLTNPEPIGRQRSLPIGGGIDYPVYEHRGVMFDVARSFIPVDGLIAMIDKFGLYKINVLHLHLSDDFPMNSKNSPDADGFFRLYSPKYPGLIPPDKLYYSKADWERLEAAAWRNGVKIIPEIESPGHSKSFTDAFPEIPRYTLTTLDVRTPANRERVATKIAEVIAEFLPWFRSGELHLGTDETDKIIAAGAPLQTTNVQIYEYANLLRQKLLRQLDPTGRPYLKSEAFTVWAYDPRKSDPLTRDPVTRLATNRGDAALDPAIAIQTWWDGQPSLVAGKQNINYIAPSRRWIEGRQQLIIPYKDNFKKLTGSSDAFYRNLHDNLGYEATLPIGLETQVWNDNTKGQGGDWSNVNAAVQKTLPGIGAIYWSGYTNSPQGWSLLRDSKSVVRASQIVAAFWIRDQRPALSVKQAHELLMQTASHWADETKTIKIDPAEDTFGWDPNDMARALSVGKRESR